MDMRKYQMLFFFGFLGLVTLLLLSLLAPFFTPIFWAAVIASILKPLHLRILSRLRRPNLCASVMLLLTVLMILLPAAVIGSLLVSESFQLYNAVSSDTSLLEQKVRHGLSLLTQNPYTKRFQLDEPFIMEKFSEGLKSIVHYLLVHLTDLTQNTLFFLVQFGVMIYTLFFFFRDADRILGTILRMSPLGVEPSKVLYEQFTTTARATLKATVILGGLQGLGGGFIFFITGIEGAVVWGLLMTVLAILPGIGCSIIWGPAGVIMLLNHHLWEGIAILSFGILVISLADNLLRPFLIGSDVEMHPLLIFLSTLGGVLVLGLSGFVIGPIVMALFLTVWKMYDQFYDPPTMGNSLQ